MNRRTNEKKRNRASNAGGVPMDANKVSLSLANAFNELRPKSPGKAPNHPVELNLFHLYFLYLWLTSQINTLRSYNDIPTLSLVTGNTPCQAHCLRRIRMNGCSWVEYALPYFFKDHVQYLWQPLPEALNSIFQEWCSYSDIPLQLSDNQKEHLFKLLKEKKWRTPAELRCKHMLRKDMLFDYFSHQAKIDPYLSTPAQSLITSTTHHRSALSYQKLNSNQIRYEIFSAQNRYLTPLVNIIHIAEFKSFCDLRRPSSQAVISAFSHPSKRPNYLKSKGEIVSFELQVTSGSRQYIEIPSIEFGSQRALSIDCLSQFFNFLRQQLQAIPTDGDLRQYYNQRTYELALLFVLLTGTRPTHHISIESDYCFELKTALIKDKGRDRTIEICEYLRSAINDYQALQKHILEHLNIDTPTCSTLWYLIDGKHQTTTLNAKVLRLFMTKKWTECFTKTHNIAVVPYMLRHSFAQHALMSSRPKLTRQQIDDLMGHSELGEHLGQAYRFSPYQQRLTKHLNGWPELLKLRPFSENKGEKQ